MKDDENDRKEMAKPYEPTFHDYWEISTTSDHSPNPEGFSNKPSLDYIYKMNYQNIKEEKLEIENKIDKIDEGHMRNLYSRVISLLSRIAFLVLVLLVASFLVEKAQGSQIVETMTFILVVLNSLR